MRISLCWLLLNNSFHPATVIMRFILLFSFLFSYSELLYAQRDSVSISRNNLLIQQLKSGKSTYAVWTKDLATEAVSKISIWNREVRFRKLKGREVIVVSQMRFYEDPVNNKYVYTVSDKQNFKTIYDFTKRIRTGIEAFNYYDNEISAADSVKENSKQGFKMTITDFPFCFELDLETLSLLPLKRAGQQLAVNFYHPGGEAPRYYPVDVIGSEQIQVTSEQKIECWKIQLRYSEDSYDFSWISNKTHELIKLEGHYPNTLFTKIKLVIPAP